MNQSIHRFAVASAIVFSTLIPGAATLAHGAPAMPTVASPAATTVTMSTVTIDRRAARRAELEQANADARRVAFRHLGTSL